MIDLEAIVETDDGTRFDKVSALLIGVVAILAAILGTLQMELSQQESRASAHAARLSVRIFEGTAGGSEPGSFELQAFQDAITLATDATSRALAALERGSGSELADALMQADTAATDRLTAIAAEMGKPPGPDAPLDPTALRAATAAPETLGAIVAEQNRQVDLAEAYGERSGRAVLGLSLVALAGVLVGLAAVLGEGGPGRFALGAAIVTAASAAVTAVIAVA